MIMCMADFVTPTQAASQGDCSASLVYRDIGRGVLPAHPDPDRGPGPARRLLIRQVDLDRWIAARECMTSDNSGALNVGLHR
jgi:hypothetical protein